MVWLILALLCAVLAAFYWLRSRRAPEGVSDDDAVVPDDVGTAPVPSDATEHASSESLSDYEEIEGRTKRLRRRFRRRVPAKVLAWTFTALTVAFLVMSLLRIVPAGSTGVPVTFGSISDQVGEGLHVVNPFTSMKIMSVRTEPYTMSGSDGSSANRAVEVLGKDGSAGLVDATLLYHVDPAESSRLYGEVGMNYRERVVQPTTRSCIRSAFTEKDIVEASTTSWLALQDEIEQCITDDLEPRGIVVEQLQLRELKLSDKVQKAVDSKVASQQDAERQRFERQFAEQQAEIERVKALATADSQQILACGGESTTIEIEDQPVEVVVPNPIAACSQAQLTPQYLQFNYIQALRELVDSPNNSTIILPFDQELTPLLNVNPGAASLDTNAATSAGPVDSTGSTTTSTTTAPEQG